VDCPAERPLFSDKRQLPLLEDVDGRLDLLRDGFIQNQSNVPEVVYHGRYRVGNRSLGSYLARSLSWQGAIRSLPGAGENP
jgi:hypothetical protein